MFLRLSAPHRGDQGHNLPPPARRLFQTEEDNEDVQPSP
jgi:hypothetical protein